LKLKKKTKNSNLQGIDQPTCNIKNSIDQPTCYYSFINSYVPEKLEQQRPNNKRKLIDMECNTPNKKFKSSRNSEILSYNDNLNQTFLNENYTDPFGIYFQETFNPHFNTNSLNFDTLQTFNDDFIYQDMVYEQGLFYNSGIDYDFLV